MGRRDVIKEFNNLLFVLFQALAKTGLKRPGEYIEEPEPKKPGNMMQQGAVTEQVTVTEEVTVTLAL